MKGSGKYCNKCYKELYTSARIGSKKFYYCIDSKCVYFALLQVPMARITKESAKELIA